MAIRRPAGRVVLNTVSLGSLCLRVRVCFPSSPVPEQASKPILELTIAQRSKATKHHTRSQRQPRIDQRRPTAMRIPAHASRAAARAAVPRLPPPENRSRPNMRTAPRRPCLLLSIRGLIPAQMRQILPRQLLLCPKRVTGRTIFSGPASLLLRGGWLHCALRSHRTVHGATPFGLKDGMKMRRVCVPPATRSSSYFSVTLALMHR
jgi:hypothetical protein